MAAKRPIVPEGNTPGKTASKRPSTQGTSRKSLFQESDRIKSASGIQKWTDEETIALVQYICLYSENAWTDKWPTGKDPEFWNACSESVNKACKSSRTGLSTMIDYNCLLSLYSLKERDISQWLSPYNLFKSILLFFWTSVWQGKKVSCKNCSFFLSVTQKVDHVAPELQSSWLGSSKPFQRLRRHCKSTTLGALLHLKKEAFLKKGPEAPQRKLC